MGASVKIMLSYDYCHFEVSKSIDDDITDAQIDQMRKEVQRLADKAVRQYITRREANARASQILRNKSMFESRCQSLIKQPEDKLTDKEKAMLEAYKSGEWLKVCAPPQYDYQDDFNIDEYPGDPYDMEFPF